MVLFVYVDNSNVWIEGQHVQAARIGLAADPLDAARRRITAKWSYDFGRLYERVCPPAEQIGRSILFGSCPPANDSLWDRAWAQGFEVKVFDRNAANKQKRVDTSLTTLMVADCFEHMKPERHDMTVLVAGDGDFIPPVQQVQKRGLKVRVFFWSHGTSRQLRAAADEFFALDPDFDYLTRDRGSGHQGPYPPLSA
jgi:hypothetical protein